MRHPAHVSRGRLVVAWTTTLLVAGFALALGSPAAAHDVLVGTQPADGAVLDEAPTQVVLTFAAEQAGVGAEVVVTGPDGSSWSDGAAVASGATVTQALAADLPDGAYTVAWRSVAQDGHPVTGTFGFTLDAPDADPATDAGDRPPATPAVDPAAGDGDAATSGATSVTDDAGAARDGTDQRGWSTWYAVGAASAVVLATAVLVRRHRRG